MCFVKFRAMLDLCGRIVASCLILPVVFGGKIRFINVIDGPHTLHAVLQRRGTLLPSTITPSIHFTTVEDPDIETPETEDEDEGEEDEIDLDKKDKKVTLDMPSLSLTVPPEKVTLPGVAVQFVSNVVATDTDVSSPLLQAFVVAARS